MSSPAQLNATYVDHVARLEHRLDTDTALRRAVGGEFVAIGKLEYHLLRSRGLRDGQLVVDVGCGSGRLACQLAAFPGIRYIGCDVVPRLLDYAADLCARPDWRFVPTNGTTIPCDDNTADFVCFFSVFTHLPQEQIYRYLRESHRVLKPGGLVLMSFLEFRVPSHWAAFIASVDSTREDEHLNQFIERDAIHAMAGPAGFDVRSLHGGDTNYIPLPEPVRYESGAVAEGAASLGQSLAVLQKREPDTSDSTRSAALQPALDPNAAASPPAPAASVVSALKNASARTHVPAGGSATLGFMLAGETARRVLIRAVGPTLSMFGVAQPLTHPQLNVHSGETLRGRAAPGSATASELVTAARIIGAFPLAADGTDAALLLSLPPGSHTAVVQSTAPAEAGDVLIEIYIL